MQTKRLTFFVGLTALMIHLLMSNINAAEKTKILFVGKQPDHPFATHMYLHTCKMLAKCVEKNGDIETIVSDGWPKDPEVTKNVKTIVVYATPAAEFLLDSPYRDQVIKLTRFRNRARYPSLGFFGSGK